MGTFTPQAQQRVIKLLGSILCLLALLLSSALPGQAAPGRQPIPQIAELTLGLSGEGRPITALKIGDGPRKFALVGDTHGGPEANTFALVSQLAEHFRANPAEVPAGVRLYIIPTLNPDGLALGTRFNARGVDLNRNMDTSTDTCPENDWNIHVQGAYGIESDTGGPFAESEAESRLIRDFLLDAAGVIFFHSSGGDVFPAFCEHPPSIAMAQAFAAASGYQYDRFWPNYMITGGMHDWAGGLGIAAITPELASGDQPEFEQNLAGVRALLADPERMLPLPEDRAEGGVLVPALIWRFWKSHGAATQLGMPLAPAAQAGGRVRQYFTNALLELDPAQADTPQLVQPAPLGRLAFGGPPEASPALREAFLAHWQQHDGALLLGPPLADERPARAADGVVRIIQVFERGALAYYPEDGSSRPEPLGWVALVRERLLTNPATQQIR